MSKGRIEENNSDEIVIKSLRKCVKDIILVPDVEWNDTSIELRQSHKLRTELKRKVLIAYLQMMIFLFASLDRQIIEYLFRIASNFCRILHYFLAIKVVLFFSIYLVIICIDFLVFFTSVSV